MQKTEVQNFQVSKYYFLYLIIFKFYTYLVQKTLELPLPKISSKSWAIFNSNTKDLILGKNHNSRREIASLTKIMTCYTVILLSKLLNIDILKEIIRINKRAENTMGTSAELSEGDQLSVHDLLHGLMLPSGNDAAVALADHFAKILYFKHNPNSIKIPRKVRKYFLIEMNKNASSLGMKRTTYTNPHGLSDKYNKSTALDIALLTSEAMNDNLFRQIVGKKHYETIGKDIENNNKKFEWNNTNLCLESGYTGVKTGKTNSAGSCLCSTININNSCIIIVVLGSRTTKKRFTETHKLTNLAKIMIDNKIIPQKSRYS